MGLSVACHVGLLMALLGARVVPPAEAVAPPITVSLVQAAELNPHPPSAPSAPAAPAKSAPLKSAPLKVRARLRPATETIEASDTAAASSASAGSGDLLTGAALGSAVGAESLPGGECNMARRVQSALRRDSLVRTAITARGAPAGASAILVWNGGWVASPGEDGRGLAAVREAIVWEVAFAPSACREGRVHGPVLFTVSDASGVARIAIGSGDWRWGDLVSSR